MVSNSTDYDSKFLTLQKDIKFPLHFRINKNYSDKKGLQSIFIEYDKACFKISEIEFIAVGLKDLLRQVMEDSSKKCKEYDVKVSHFFKAENYYNNLINSFDNPTSISPDYNRVATGYHFNTDLTVEEYLDDFKKGFEEYNDYPLLNNRKLGFESEILFFIDKYDAKDYKLVFNYESGKINVSYDESFYSEELMGAFLDAMDVLLDRFALSGELLKNISIRSEIELDEGFEIELANEGIVNKVFENIASENPDKTILYAEDANLTYDELNKKANTMQKMQISPMMS